MNFGGLLIYKPRKAGRLEAVIPLSSGFLARCSHGYIWHISPKGKVTEYFFPLTSALIH